MTTKEKSSFSLKRQIPVKNIRHLKKHGTSLYNSVPYSCLPCIEIKLNPLGSTVFSVNSRSFRLKPYTLQTAFNGFLDMSVESPESENGKYQEFQARVRRRMSEKPFYYNMSKNTEVRQQNCRKSSPEECILDYIALHFECRINKSSLLQFYFLAVFPNKKVISIS